MRTKRLILTLLLSALLLHVKAVEKGVTGDHFDISRILKVLKIPNEYQINDITRKTNEDKTFSSVLRKFKSKNRTSSHYFLKFRTHRVHFTPSKFLKRFNRKKQFFQTHYRVKFDTLHIKPHLAVLSKVSHIPSPFAKNNYIVLQGKLHQMLHGKHFSPKLSVVKLMYAIVDRFWTPPAPSCCPHCCGKSRH
ncbi:uncharacterized protein LOC115759834 [Drosophila novamexicana]|uniref:uncharacterized protein LOC115759834 n=1 Tax=Drosophila novamexicana TaxID=47314 RepID=UPI0011E5FC85|nr:uncharacterized protein LOC115759834 [Drosophila novamexicana]